MKRGVSAIVPAYNEAPRIGRVLETLVACPAISEVIVVDDGSIDGTALVAERYPVRLIRNTKNQGKGKALDVGVQNANHDVLFFCDADIIGLTRAMINAIVKPVLYGEYDMFVAARRSKVRHLGFGLRCSPLLDGQRALTRELWDSVSVRYKQRFEIETALNHRAARAPYNYNFNYFDIAQVRKEEKRGYCNGLSARYAMYSDIARTTLSLRLNSQ